MLINKFVYLAVILGLSFFAATCQGQLVKVDGRSEEWASASFHVDLDEGGTGLIDAVGLLDDEERIFIQVQLTESILLQQADDFQLSIDVDDNSSTGQFSGGIGVDFYYNFGERFGRLFGPNGSRFIDHEDVELVSAPSVTSALFEISMSKSLLPVQAGNNLAIYLTANNTRVPSSGALDFSLNSSSVTSATWSAQKHDEDIRIISYNVLFDQLFMPSATSSYRRIFQALQPDIICFQEVFDYNANDVLDRMVELGMGDLRYAAKIQPDIVVCSRFPIEDFDDIRNTDNGIFELDIHGQPWFIVNAHLPCCEQNEGREFEIDNIHAYLREARLGNERIQIPNEAPIIIAGDMNTVGNARQLSSLRSGDIVDEDTFGPDYMPDWDDTALSDLTPAVTGAPFTATWFSTSSSFSPGRLDMILYTDAVISARQAFVLHSAYLTDAQGSATGIQRFDTEVASDHKPVIYDFFMGASNTNLTEHTEEYIRIAPMPVLEVLTAEWPEHWQVHSILITDAAGRQVHHEVVTGDRLNLPVAHLPSGKYVLSLITSKGKINKSWIKH